MTPGAHTISAERYHADPCEVPSLSSSIAKILIDQSPLHAWTAHPRLNPNYVAEEKEAFDIGSAAHALLLEGQDRMVIVKADDWRTKIAREARDQARAEGKHPVLEAKYQDVMKMRDVAVRAIAECADLSGLTLADGKSEQVIVWEDLGGVVCRARIDFLANGEIVILDYKSTTDAAPRAFNRQIARMGYHYQDEFYSRGVEKVFGRRPKFIFLAQETTAPHACSFHGCAPSLKAIAEQDVGYAIRTWGGCLAANRWPAHAQRIHWAEAMPWQMNEHMEREDARGIPYEPAKLWSKPRNTDEGAPIDFDDLVRRHM